MGEKGACTVSLGLLAAAWTTTNDAASAILDSALSINVILKEVSERVIENFRGKTCGVLAECEWHMLWITTDLDIDHTKLAEDLGNSNFESFVRLRLKETFVKLA